MKIVQIHCNSCAASENNISTEIIQSPCYIRAKCLLLSVQHRGHTENVQYVSYKLQICNFSNLYILPNKIIEAAGTHESVRCHTKIAMLPYQRPNGLEVSGILLILPYIYTYIRLLLLVLMLHWKVRYQFITIQPFTA